MYSYAILLIVTASTLFITVLYIDCAPFFLLRAISTCIGQLSNLDFVISNIWRWLRPNTHSCMGYHCIGELRGGGTTTPPRCHIVGKNLMRAGGARWSAEVRWEILCQLRRLLNCRAVPRTTQRVGIVTIICTTLRGYTAHCPYKMATAQLL